MFSNSGDDAIFRGFNGGLVAKNLGKTTPIDPGNQVRAIYALPFPFVWRHIWAYPRRV
jgi:hypothetical protein